MNDVRAPLAPATQDSFSPQALLANERQFWFPSSTRQMWLLAIVFAGCVFLVSWGIDWLLLREGSTRMTVDISDGLAGLIAGGLFLRILHYGRERRDNVRRKLEAIAEMNHHIRNALQVISLSTHVNGNRAEVATIDDAVNRIQWALREILPKS